jgi:hypothetical protein
VPRTANDDLLTGRAAQEEEPELIGCARRPEAGQIPGELMDAERRVAFIRIEELEGLGEPLSVRLAEGSERVEELRGEPEGR